MLITVTDAQHAEFPGHLQANPRQAGNADAIHGTHETLAGA